MITTLTNTVVAAVIIGCFSLALWKDNPLYRWVEYSSVAVPLAYTCVISTKSLWTIATVPIVTGTSLQLIIPVILMFLAFGQFVRGQRWTLRWPMSFAVGFGLAIAAKTVPVANFITQIKGIALPFATATGIGIFSVIVMLVCAITSMTYFTFTREHKGPIGILARIGRWFLMAGFAAMYGAAVNTFIACCIYSVLFILRTWLGIA